MDLYKSSYKYTTLPFYISKNIIEKITFYTLQTQVLRNKQLFNISSFQHNKNCQVSVSIEALQPKLFV